MEHVNLFIAQIAVIFLPGIIWCKLDARFGVKEKRSELDFFVATFVYGIVAYVATFLAYSLCGVPFSLIDLKRAEDKAVLNHDIIIEIITATCFGFFLGVI